MCITISVRVVAAHAGIRGSTYPKPASARKQLSHTRKSQAIFQQKARYCSGRTLRTISQSIRDCRRHVYVANSINP